MTVHRRKTAKARRRTIERRHAMSPTTAQKHPVKIAPSYLRELRARVEAIGVVAVAAAAGIDRRTIWRHVSGGEGRRPSPSAIETIRLAVSKLDGAPMPPPTVSVRCSDHFAWLALADEIAADDLPRLTADAARLVRRRK